MPIKSTTLVYIEKVSLLKLIHFILDGLVPLIYYCQWFLFLIKYMSNEYKVGKSFVMSVSISVLLHRMSDDGIISIINCVCTV